MARKDFAKQHRQPTPRKGEWDAVLAAAKSDEARFREVSKESREGYQLAWANRRGFNMATAAKGTRYHMKAAGLYVMKKELRKLKAAADKVLSDKKLLAPVKAAMFAELGEAIWGKLEDLRKWDDQPWEQGLAKVERLQKPHKQRPATDSELAALHEAAKGSDFRIPLLVAEFSGCRGAEFDREKHGGIGVEKAKKGGVDVLRFHISSAKTDGKNKGLDLRCIEVPRPDNASPEVQARWEELAELVKPGKNLVVAIDSTEKQTPGVRFTNAVKFIAKKAGVSVAAYSLRHRFSAQVKAANEGDAVAVALALGHQTTNTQEHYGRAHRGKGGISPVASKGVAVAGQPSIRGARQRTGPPAHVKTKATLKASTPHANASKSRGARL